MNTYKAIIAYTNEHSNTQHFVITGITADTMIEAFNTAMDKFFDEHAKFEIKKIVIEAQRSTWKADDNIYRGS